MASSFDISAVFADLVGRYLRMPLVQKIALPVILFGAVALIVVVARWSNEPDYSVLFSDLSETDSAAVVDHLKEQKVKYELRSGGSTVAVSPPEVVPELRITLAAAGVPSGGKVGFEIFDHDNIGLTGFAEQMKLRRALQGELERTIMSIDGIVKARVHITKPEKSVFASEEGVATASVLLRLSKKEGLELNQIKGIRNLVAGSVEGLKQESVSIIDSSGKLLNPTEENKEDIFGVEATRLQYQKQIEESYADRVEQMISRVIGTGKVSAKVTAEIDFSSNVKEEENFDPASQVVRSERNIVEGSAAATGRGGVPGVVSNLTDDPKLLTPQGSGEEQSKRSETLKNYEVSKSVVKTSSPRGVLTRISVAVLVDGLYESVGGEDPKAKKFVPLPEETIARITSLVKAAVGYDQVRGDSIIVENIQFKSLDDSIGEELEGMSFGDYLHIGSYFGTPLFVFFFLIFFVRPLIKFVTSPNDAELTLERLLPSGLQDLEKELKSERSRPEIPQPEPTIDLTQLEELISENSSIVRENPQQAALLIRYWLNEGRM
jgi:flagellar M-ring protein FliF